jgi:hypothetical protein
MNSDPWQGLADELDLWAQAGRSIQLWLRDDDAVAPSPALDRLARLSERFDLPVLLAVIPMLAEPDLAKALKTMPSLRPCQHGTWHRNHAPPGGKKSEFGAQRPADEVEAELRLGSARLEELLGPLLLPVFVPPWNRIDPALAVKLPGLGFSGLSCFRGFALPPGGGPTLVNTDIDVMDWQDGRVGRSAPALATEIHTHLLARRQRNASPDTALGLLLHHRDHDESGWNALENLLTRLRAHPAVSATDPRALFGPLVCS